MPGPLTVRLSPTTGITNGASAILYYSVSSTDTSPTQCGTGTCTSAGVATVTGTVPGGTYYIYLSLDVDKHTISTAATTTLVVESPITRYVYAKGTGITSYYPASAVVQAGSTYSYYLYEPSAWEIPHARITLTIDCALLPTGQAWLYTFKENDGNVPDPGFLYSPITRKVTYASATLELPSSGTVLICYLTHAKFVENGHVYGPSLLYITQGGTTTSTVCGPNWVAVPFSGRPTYVTFHECVLASTMLVSWKSLSYP
jgi:hypothetical protein